MTDTDTPNLGTYDGLDVLGATVSIRNAGDGLSESMAVDPVKLPVHDTVHVVLECEVTKHTYEEVKDTNGLRLVNVLRAGRATIIDRDQVTAALDEQQRRIDEASGQLTLEVDGGDEPEAVGDVLGDAIDLASVAEHTSDWRNKRTKELDGFDKPGLVELAKEYGLADDLVKAELVETIVDHEESNGGAA